MKILCTGGAGYFGSVLVPMLLEHNHDVTVVDSFRHGQPSLLQWCYHPRLTIINHDVRADPTRHLKGMDVIIPLAALVGAPICDKNPNEAWSINHTEINYLCRSEARLNQTILFPMTNSGYSSGGEIECTENSQLKPISIYGQSKVLAEKAVLSHPQGISFRFATLFGCSPRMRLDLLVNDFTYRAVRDRSLTLFEANFRRNYLHVRDAARVFLFAIEHAESKSMFGQAYNVGLSSANLSKRELCERIAGQVPGFVFHEAAVGKDPDQRNYVVSNAKIEALGFKPWYSIDYGITELIKGYQMPLDSVYRNA
ncbi:MAG: NAD(P)-dependent oxidoreductase [Dehalococcoidales bacterium]|nr:NAD(P)-dependent oxidoreductase [Dehalococcoidales bacterium]